MSERFIVKGTRIKDTGCDEYLTLREVCIVLNNQDKVINELSSLLTNAEIKNEKV